VEVKLLAVDAPHAGLTLREVASTRWGTYRYMNMKHLYDIEKEVMVQTGA